QARGSSAPCSPPARRWRPPRHRRARCARRKAPARPGARSPSGRSPAPPASTPAGRWRAAPAASAGSSRGRSAPARPDRSSAAGRARPGAGSQAQVRSSRIVTGPLLRCSDSASIVHGLPPHRTLAPMAENRTSFPRQDIRVLLLEGVSQSAVDAFRDAGYSLVDYRDKSLAGDALKEAIAGAHLVGIRSRTQLDADALAHARKLIAIGCFCIGTNQVDLEAAQLAGIPVFNAPYSNARSVAELVIAEAILLMRGIPRRNAECHRGGWSKNAAGSHEVRGKTLGIVGYGHIGTQVGLLAEALGMQVLFHDVETKLALGNARVAAGLDDLLARSDVVTLHVPET